MGREDTSTGDCNERWWEVSLGEYCRRRGRWRCWGGGLVKTSGEEGVGDTGICVGGGGINTGRYVMKKDRNWETVIKEKQQNVGRNKT